MPLAVISNIILYVPPKSAGVVVAGSSQSLKIHFTEAEKSK